MKWFGVLTAVSLLGCATTTSATSAGKPSRLEQQRLSAEAQAQYDAKDFAKCGPTFVKTDEHYNAACCFALSGSIDDAFAQLSLEAKRGRAPFAQYEQDTDFATLRSDARWAELTKRIDAGITARNATLNTELRTLFEQDQADRSDPKADWTLVEKRDKEREARVDAILTAGGAKVADDYFHAAMVFQHGGTAEYAQRARDLSLQGVKLDPEHKGARWLAAASLDRKLMYEKKPQKYGTQFSREGTGPWTLWECDPKTTDEERAEWGVPTLDEQRRRLVEMNKPGAMP